MKRFDDMMVFVAVVERSSFVGAARQLGVSQTAVSRKIQELEHRLGVKLVNRTTRRLSITDVGREVYELAARGFAAIEDAERIAARRQETPSGVLRAVLPYSLSHLAIMPLIPTFRAQYPLVRLEFVITNQPIDLIEYNCDIGIRIGALEDSSYIVRPLATVEFIVVAAPDFLARHGRPKAPCDLQKAPIAGLCKPAQAAAIGHSLQNYEFVKGGRREPTALQYAFAASEPALLVDFALQGQGAVIIPELVVLRDLASGSLETLLPDWKIDARVELSILYRRHATLESKTLVFLDFLRRNLREVLSALGET